MMDNDLIRAVLNSLQKNSYPLLGDKILDSLLKDQRGSYNKSIKKGESIEIGNRTIYPLIIITSFEMEDKLMYEGITPFALAVIEPDQKYFISLDEKNQEISKLISDEDLWDELEIRY